MMLGDEPQTYLESAEGVEISRERALTELRKHGVNTCDEFLADMGDKPVYLAPEVLAWLGY